jgi:hypothetical protein
MGSQPVVLVDQPLFDSIHAKQVTILGARKGYTKDINLSRCRDGQSRLVCDFWVSKVAIAVASNVPESLSNLLPPLETWYFVPWIVTTFGGMVANGLPPAFGA